MTLLKVNDVDLRNGTIAMAEKALNSACGEVRLQVLRPEKQLERTLSEEEEELYDTFEVELMKKKGKGLGLSIVSRLVPGAFYSHLLSL